ncbi:TPA: restriction endonuclease subunit S [Yersinia enterocolitica]|uniref:restriction endonuclease subunit S n=1 Tax=Yersinia frederiksenii TaxID=29484 RepID=UPI00119CDE5C|nr:restriction endonuclease subunit S [Yersinia frederiksenii]EKN3569200.1 restriction endonuclease subunit S [Yersinia enterocolitica]HDV5953813.1 restriction endonuclease subunit S [Yersinia enterocolitica]HDW8059619.1 restriction endonuclease subunit S [Yersinia enterocolitica]
MSGSNKCPLIPKLRFPEFRDAGEWREKKLGDCLDYQQPTAYLVSDTNYKDSYETPVLTAGKTFVLGYTNEKNGIYSENLPVIIFDDFTTASKFVDFPFKAKSSAMKILQAKKGVNIRFIYEIMQMISYEVGGHERHWISKFASMSILLPQPMEQQKIANCLSSLDELITAETHRQNALKNYKKGLIQQLFPHEGKDLPCLRFSEFSHSKPWKKEVISNLLEKVINPVNVEANKAYREIGIRSHGKGVFHKAPILGAALGNKRVFWVEENVLMVNIVFAWEQAIAITSSAENGMIASHRFPMYRPKQKIDLRFLKYLFLTAKGKELLGIASPGGAGRNKTLGQKEFEKLELLIPEDIQEQTAIADVISAFDNLLEIQGQKIDALKAHKRGLMQQLFPMFDEVYA